MLLLKVTEPSLMLFAMRSLLILTLNFFIICLIFFILISLLVIIGESASVSAAISVHINCDLGAFSLVWMWSSTSSSLGVLSRMLSAVSIWSSANRILIIEIIISLVVLAIIHKAAITIRSHRRAHFFKLALNIASLDWRRSHNWWCTASFISIGLILCSFKLNNQFIQCFLQDWRNAWNQPCLLVDVRDRRYDMHDLLNLLFYLVDRVHCLLVTLSLLIGIITSICFRSLCCTLWCWLFFIVSVKALNHFFDGFAHFQGLAFGAVEVAVS